MFVGHYAAALALKRVEGMAPLGLLFLGVQFVDILFFPFVLMGIERMNISPGFTESTHFELVFMPYTHSLVASLLWAGMATGLAYLVLRPRRLSVALAVGAAVFSHWVLDLLVHTPDLPLFRDSGIKLGLGLWNYAAITFTLEAILLIVALWLYMSSTTAVRDARVARFGMPIFVAVLVALNVYNIFGPPPADFMAVFVPAMASYLGFAGVAFWLDRSREPVASTAT